MSITAFTARRARTLRLAAAGLTAVAALTLTACNSNEGTGTKGEGKADSATSTPADQTSGSGGTGGSDGSDTGSGAKKGGGTDQAGSSKNGGSGSGGSKDSAGSNDSAGSQQEIGPCDINKLTIGVKSVQRPVNYMVLEVNNHAGVDCNMPSYPRLKFGEDAQSATPVNEDSKPQAVVTLAPGETAYAGIRTSSADGSGTNGYKATSLDVFLEGSDDSKPVELPGGSVYIDDSAQVTYWQSDLANALD
ncbi:DUF4232 domain-containing protein [Streptomyces sp. LZ34]